MISQVSLGGMEFIGEGAAMLVVIFPIFDSMEIIHWEIHVEFELLSGFWFIVYYYVFQVSFLFQNLRMEIL